MTHTKDEALKLALKALTPFSTPNWAGTGVDKANEAITAIKQALAAPVQPMAHIVGEIDHAGKVWKPAQRTWIGLTDEEIEQEFGFIDELLRDCVHRTEAKLKEKNGI